jgi:hypothetical protein
MSTLLAVLGVLAAVAVSSPAKAQEPRSPHDVTTYPVVYRVPGMADVVVRPGIPYATGSAGPLALDLYLPKGPAGGPWPVVLFANGVGDGVAGKLKDWEIYRTWARLMAAHGVAALTMEAEPGRTPERIAQAVEHVRREGPALGLDPGRVGLWACSGNVAAALPYAMGTSPLRAAVFFYGTATVPALRKDLPVMSVMAGRDYPALIEGQRALWTRAAQDKVPWTMVLANDLPHAFDGLVETAPSRQIVQDTVAFLVRHLAPAESAPPVSPARAALIRAFGWEWKEAAEAYGTIVAESPTDRDARRQYARALSRSGRGAEAIPEFRKVIAMGDDGPGIRFELATVLFDEKQYEAAVAEDDAAIARGGAAGVGHFNAARALARAGRVEEALDRLEKAAAAGFATRARLEGDEDLASLRGQPRFQALLR